MSDIPFSKPFIGGRELPYVTEAVTQGQIGSDGPFTRCCAALLEQVFNIERVLMTPSCTSALEMAAMLCGLGRGDEVILPSYTFVSTASAICRVGARPVFVDIRPDTLNLDETLIEDAITSRTKAVFAMHYAGVGCEMDPIMTTAQRHGLIVVEDAAQGVNARYRGRALGSIGHMGTYSFHDTKNYVCGEGGAILLNRPEFVERAEILHDKGTNRRQFVRGQVDKYTWLDVGSSYAPSEIACAFLLGQLELLDQIDERRKEVWQTYYHGLADLEASGELRRPHVPRHCQSNSHMFYILLPDRRARNQLIDYLKRNGIQATFHYVPLHTSPMGRRLTATLPMASICDAPLPVTEDLSQRLVRLPLYSDITDCDQRRVIDNVYEFFGAVSQRAA